MSDGVSMDLTSVATHGGVAAAVTTAVTAFMRWVNGKEAQEVSTKLALMQQTLDALVTGASKADSMREDLALMKQTVQALHERVDRLDGRRRR